MINQMKVISEKIKFFKFGPAYGLRIPGIIYGENN